MNKDVSESFESHFGKSKDPRIDRKKLYPLVEVMFVVLCGSICGAESWRDFVLFGKSKVDYLRQYYAFENGIPSKNTFARIFAALDTEMFKMHFVQWVKSLQSVLNEVIAKGHGRIETRKCFVSDQVDWLNQKEQWVGLKTIVMLEETQETKGNSSTEQRFFISSLQANC